MDVFVYGTLTSPERAGDLLDSFVFVGPAVLDGLHAVDGRYPTLAPGGTVGGRLLRTDELATLDAYEGVDDGLYVRVSVPLADGDDEVAVYVGDPDRLAVDEPVEWPGAGSLADRVTGYVADSGVVVRRTD
jgi:gamma-glutamylcyclotransferase (GGCT)/AIG2-like uncharacterized protein YtfP